MDGINEKSFATDIKHMIHQKDEVSEWKETETKRRSGERGCRREGRGV